MKKISAYQKRKNEIEELKNEVNKITNDLRKVLNNDIETRTHWQVIFKMQDEIEKTIWFGNTTLNNAASI